MAAHTWPRMVPKWQSGGLIRRAFDSNRMFPRRAFEIEPEEEELAAGLKRLARRLPDQQRKVHFLLLGYLPPGGARSNNSLLIIRVLGCPDSALFLLSSCTRKGTGAREARGGRTMHYIRCCVNRSKQSKQQS
eukprot:5821181-Pyramimonas_sp.AAC.1